MPTNTASKMIGQVLIDSADDANDVAHVCRKTIVAHVEGTLIGDVTQQILLDVPQTDITITSVKCYPSLGITKGDTLPVVTICKADLAAGSNTAVSTVIDLTAAGFTAKTAVTGTVSAGAVTAGEGVYALFTKSSTGAVVGDTKMTFLIDYDTAN